jgi:hypothetical protein
MYIFCNCLLVSLHNTIETRYTTVVGNNYGNKWLLGISVLDPGAEPGISTKTLSLREKFVYGDELG